ncbi:MBL fold metallo-hydrolase [bacterium]|nr:MBL fold metallo-hydrolase [bacterium]
MPAKVAEVHSGIYEVFLPLPMRPTIVNVYLIDCHGAWALIDTGMNTADSVATLEDACRQVGTRLEDINVVIGTHHHVDHFGTSATIKKRSGATTLLHRLEQERVNRMLTLGPPSQNPDAMAFFQTHGFPVDKYPIEGMRPTWMGTDQYNPVPTPDRYLNDGDVVMIGDRELEIIWTPGHAPGHCVIYLRKEKVLIVGDHLLPKITPHVGVYPSGPTNPLGDFINSQLKVQRFDVEHVLPAHGAVYHDHRHRANQLIEHHRYREAEMLDLVRRKPQCAYEVASQIFGDEERPIFHVMAATFETLAHLELACVEGRAKKKVENGRTLFQTV